MRPLGETQADFLRSMTATHGVGRARYWGVWFSDCGWIWESRSRSVSVARSLERRGLVAEINPPPMGFPPYFEITSAGKIALAEIEAHRWNDTPPEVHEQRARAAEKARMRYAAEQRDLELRRQWAATAKARQGKRLKRLLRAN